MIKLLDIELRDLDRVIIYDKLSMFEDRSVSITGFVESPGKKLRMGMTVSDLLFLGGGFDKQSQKYNTYFEKSRTE